MRGGWTRLEPLMRYNISDEDTLADFSDVVAWLSRAVPTMPRTARSTRSPAAGTEVAGCLETPMRFGRRGRLFGVLCQPRTGPDWR